jgi:hypothetical protein
MGKGGGSDGSIITDEALSSMRMAVCCRVGYRKTGQIKQLNDHLGCSVFLKIHGEQRYLPDWQGSPVRNRHI